MGDAYSFAGENQYCNSNCIFDFFVVSPKRRLPISQSLFWLMVLFLGIVPNMLSSKWQGCVLFSCFPYHIHCITV